MSLQELRKKYAPYLAKPKKVPTEIARQYQKDTRLYKLQNPNWHNTDIKGHPQTLIVGGKLIY